MIDLGHEETERLLAEVEMRIYSEYRAAFNTIEDRLNEFLDEFAEEDKKMKAKLNAGKISKQRYQKWRKEQIMMKKHWIRMRDTIAADIHNANEIARSVVNGYLPEAYAINMNYGTYLVEHGLSVETHFELYSRQSVERLLKENRDLLPNYNSKLAEGKDILFQKQRLQSIALRSILTGESIPRIAEHIADEMRITNTNNTIKYARTAMTSAQNAGREDSYKRAEGMGIKLKQMWIATLDNRTRHEHRQLDGQVVEINKPFKVDGEEIKFPGDPDAPGYLVWNCRCTTVPQLEGFETRADELTLRDTSHMKKGQTYEQWKEALKKDDSRKRDK